MIYLGQDVLRAGELMRMVLAALAIWCSLSVLTAGALSVAARGAQLGKIGRRYTYRRRREDVLSASRRLCGPSGT
jgi:hypothetical protein